MFLSDNTIAYRGVLITAKPQVAELLYLLVRHWPDAVKYQDLMCGLWGLHEPENACAAIRVRMTEARRLLAPLGIRIVNGWRAYRLVLPTQAQ